jgi:hypothetical protein
VTYSCWEIHQESRHNLLKKKNRNESLIFTTGWWFSPGPLVSSTNKTNRHDIAEILLKTQRKEIISNQVKN